MSLIPASGGPHHAWATHAWETIRYAIDSNARTARLVVILLALGLLGMTPILVLALAHYVFR